MTASSSLSGSWTGRYDYDSIAHGAPVSFDAVLTETGSFLRGEIVEPNTFRDEATEMLLAVLVGSRAGSLVTFTKSYTDFDQGDNPIYEGQVNATATRITGRWYFPSVLGIRGTFLLARTAHAAARKSTKTAVEMMLDFEGAD